MKLTERLVPAQVELEGNAGARLEAVPSAPLGVDGARPPIVAAAWGRPPPHFARFVLDAPAGLTRQRADDVAAPEAFSFELSDADGGSRLAACVRFDWPVSDASVEKLAAAARDAADSWAASRPSANDAFSAAWDEASEGPASPAARPSPLRDVSRPFGLGRIARDDEHWGVYAPVAFCVVFRRADALPAMRTACFELYRLALSQNGRAFRVVLATLRLLPLPPPEALVDVSV